MNFGGPVWHASIGGNLASVVKRRLAIEALRGVGQQSVQWEKDRMAYHIRRLMTPAEAERIGGLCDLRGTAEGLSRLMAVSAVLPPPAIMFAKDELGIQS